MVSTTYVSELGKNLVRCIVMNEFRPLKNKKKEM